MTIIPNNSLSSNWKPLALSVIGRGHAATRPLRALEAGQSWLEMDSMAVLETKAAPLTAAIMVVAALDRLHICATSRHHPLDLPTLQVSVCRVQC